MSVLISYHIIAIDGKLKTIINASCTNTSTPIISIYFFRFYAMQVPSGGVYQVQVIINNSCECELNTSMIGEKPNLTLY